MQRFNVDNVESRFIKNILLNTYLPNFPIVCEGDYLVADVLYTFGCKVIKCETSGVLIVDNIYRDVIPYVYRTGSSVDMAPACSDVVLCRPDLLCGAGLRLATYTVVAEFTPYKKMPGVTSNFISHSGIYGAEVHTQLGKYVRWYKSYYGIDLMPLYNCFTNTDTTYFHLTSTGIVDGNNPDVTTWVVPALLNKTYQIYINSLDNVLVKGVFMNDLGRVKSKDNEDTYLDLQLNDDMLLIPGSTYSRPITYKTFTSDNKILAYNNYFYIVLQVPKRHSGSIVVMESDKPTTATEVITSREVYVERQDKDWVDVEYDRFNPRVKSSLTVISTKQSIPYSDRLIEYLLTNVIDSKEDISQNIERLQNALNVTNKYGLDSGVWNSILKQLLYNKHFEHKSYSYIDKKCPNENDVKFINPNKLIYAKDENGNYREPKQIIGTKNIKNKVTSNIKTDILGYCDKDVEDTIYKYRSV